MTEEYTKIYCESMAKSLEDKLFFLNEIDICEAYKASFILEIYIKVQFNSDFWKAASLFITIRNIQIFKFTSVE